MAQTQAERRVLIGGHNSHEREAPVGQPFGALLRHWRQLRGRSQFDLALDAGISARHLSFLETGRSAPSREMVSLLAESLNIPLRESNALLESAGFARLYREISLSDAEARIAREAVGLVLANQEPFPAVVMDRYWNILQANNSAQRFFSTLLAGATGEPPNNVLRLMFHPDWLKPYVTNWSAVASGLLNRVRREAVCGVVDQQTQKLLDEILTYPGMSDRERSPVYNTQFSPIVTIDWCKGDLRASFFSTVTTLGTPQDIALQEMRIECFFPADEATKMSPFFREGDVSGKTR
jgi:transcriptional regulator with XRE-family HTH domain